MMKPSLLAHFHPDERPFVERMADLIERAAAQHCIKLTDFLDPRQAFIVTSLVHHHPDLQVSFEGGYQEAERKRALIAPDYYAIQPSDAKLRLIAITSHDEKMAELDHGDYLGALLGLGIKREKIGDIHVSEQLCQCVVAEEMADFIDLHLRQVHRVQVHTENQAIEALVPVVPKLEELTFTVASMRLDGIVGDVWRLSRAKALLPIKAGRCRVNWKVVEDPSCPLKEGDTVSLKGFGRFVLQRVEGETKRGRIRLTVAKFV